MCLYTDKLYENQQCKSLAHINNSEFCDARKQICIVNSHNEHTIKHNDIDEEVKELIENAIKHNLSQQSVFDAVQNLNTRIGTAMNREY